MLVGRNAKAFEPKRNTNKKKGCKGKDEPNTLNPSVYPTMVFLSDVEPDVIISRVTHEFGCSGGFIFKRSSSSVKKRLPHLFYFLYTFNDIATLRGELTSLLEEAHQGMEDNFMLPEEFEYAITRILIFIVASQNSLVNLEAIFATTCVRCRRHAEHISLNAISRRYPSCML